MKKHYGQKKIGDKSCQSKSDKLASDFGSFFLSYLITTKKKLNVPEKPKLKCLGFTYNGAKLFNMLPIKMKKMEDPHC